MTSERAGGLEKDVLRCDEADASARARPMHIGMIAALGKPRIMALVGLTTLAGYVAAGGLAAQGPLRGVFLIVGTMLAAAGANALNQVAEAREDAAMARTAARPIPSGAMDARAALLIAALLELTGLAMLYLLVNPLTALLALITTFVYILVYTPLKRVTPYSMIAGAVAGAIPPMMGWTGATGELSNGAWAFFLILFVWQIPHFISLSYIHRADYAAAGFKTLSSCGDASISARYVSLVYALALVPASLSPALAGAGAAYVIGTLALSSLFVLPALTFFAAGGAKPARRLFLASVRYMFLLMLLTMADAGVRHFA